MSHISLRNMSVEELIDRFTSIALAEYQAIEFEDNARFGRLFGQMRELLAEFKKTTDPAKTCADGPLCAPQSSGSLYGGPRHILFCAR